MLLHEPTPAQPPQQSLRPPSDRGPFGPLLEPGQNVLWSRRSLSPAVVNALEEVADGDPFEHQGMLDVTDLDLSELLQSVSNPLAKRFLAEDITSILADFSTALGTRHLHGNLAVIAHDKCRKFHTDYVTVRLLCTYAGPGTEWIRNEDVVRHNLARTDVDVEAANQSVLRAPDVVNHCPTGDVLLLKGDLFDGNHGAGAVHRSPPIKQHGLHRLLFKLDEQPCGC